VPVPDQHWPFTQAPVQTVSLAHVFRTQPSVGLTHVKFVGQLVELHVFGMQCPLSMLHWRKPAGVDVQS
jgi:hypothetical protein